MAEGNAKSEYIKLRVLRHLFDKLFSEVYREIGLPMSYYEKHGEVLTMLDKHVERTESLLTEPEIAEADEIAEVLESDVKAKIEAVMPEGF